VTLRPALTAVHRAGGLWLWPLSVVIALSAVALTLEDPFKAAVSTTVEPTYATVYARFNYRF